MVWPLLQEHSYLGASIEDNRVMSYFGETPLDEALEGVCLFDLTGNLYQFVSGDGVQSYQEALCASEKLPAGSCSFSAVLTGDGALISVPLVVRGGEHEYMVIDAGARGEILEGWMWVVRSIEQDGTAPYEGVTIEDASGLLVPLLVCGARVQDLIRDYTADQALPGAGAVGSIAFDGVPCVLAHLDGFPADSFIVFAPPSFSVRLFRSFLSFSYVHPQGANALEALLSQLPWGSILFKEDRIEVPGSQLDAWHLLRPDADFIGARSLS